MIETRFLFALGYALENDLPTFFPAWYSLELEAFDSFISHFQFGDQGCDLGYVYRFTYGSGDLRFVGYEEGKEREIKTALLNEKFFE